MKRAVIALAPRSQDELGTAAITSLRPILACARAEGVDVSLLLTELGVDATKLDDPDVRIPDDIHDRVWRECAARSGDDLFGFHVKDHVDLGAYDALDYAMWSSATLGDALERLERFHRLLCDSIAMSVRSVSDAVHVRRLTEQHGRHAVEFFLAFVVRRVRELTARHIAPREVRCAHRAPANVEPLIAFFDCPVRFDHLTSELVLSAEELMLPVTTAKPGLAAVLDRYLRACLARLPPHHSFVERVRHAITATLSNGERPSLAATARALRASPRTVQRRLIGYGTAHRDELDSIRRELAHSLLEEQHVSVTETAFLLGFSDLSGFRRAFLRWTGRSPTRARSNGH